MDLDVIFYGNEEFRADYSEFFFDYFNDDFTSCTITYSPDSAPSEIEEHKDVAMVISAEIICNGKNITDFGEGKVKVQIPFEPATGTKGSDYKIIYVADDGKLENITTSYKDGFLVAELEHFSEYVIVNTATENSANPPAGNTGVLWLCAGLMGMVVAALGEMDIAEAGFIGLNDVFADIFNVLIYKGRRVVQEDELIELSRTTQYKSDDDELLIARSC